MTAAIADFLPNGAKIFAETNNCLEFSFFLAPYLVLTATVISEL